ncbi:hypothetical protein HD554DRAFT_2322541 [Boletus coccyginus]|nr:hypothetical protein HD554DRAFT_2322541 [Boletus coccyginus]
MVSQHYIPRFNLTPNTSSSSTTPASHSRHPYPRSNHILSHSVCTSHFHCTTHEVLCIAAGRANLEVVTEIKKGDVIIVPAGVAHRLLEDLDGGFMVVGSYPKGKSWNMCYGWEDEQEKIERNQRIKDLAWFTKDPIYGSNMLT